MGSPDAQEQLCSDRIQPHLPTWVSDTKETSRLTREEPWQQPLHIKLGMNTIQSPCMQSTKIHRQVQ